jgi:integrase
MLNRAREDKLLAVVPRIRCRAEEPRTMVLDTATEARLFQYLPETARQVVTIMRDRGARNGEALAMRWEHLNWEKGSDAVQGGKTRAARRQFPPLSNRVLEILNRRHLAQGMPSQGWVFPGVGRTGYLQSINGAFSRAGAKAGLDKRLVPYCARTMRDRS